MPHAIDEPLFTDDFDRTNHLLIPSGYQQQERKTALAYTRTRHGNSDIYRAAVMEAIRKLA